MKVKDAKRYLDSLNDDTEVEVVIIGRVVSSGQVEAMGVSRQLLGYYVKNGYIRTVPVGKQKKYVLEDVVKVKKLLQ